MHIFHNWSRWEDSGTKMIRQTVDPLGAQLKEGEKGAILRMYRVQERRCKVCERLEIRSVEF